MADLNGFDANEVEPRTPFKVLPAGDYVVYMVESETKPNSKKTGTFLECVFEIVEGEHKGAKLWSRLNLSNPNPVAVEIAKADLSAICRAVGIMKPPDSTALHNIPLVVKVIVKKRDDNGEPTNEIKDYWKKPSSLKKKSEQGEQGQTVAGGETQQVEANRVEGSEEKPAWQK